MPIRQSSFPKNELLILLLLTGPLISIGCGPRTVWDIPADALMSSLSRSDYSQLAALDLRTRDVSPALDLGPGGPYCLSEIFAALGQPEVSRRLLELAWIRSTDPWKTEAGLSLGRAYVSERSLEAAAKIARELISVNKGKPGEAQARRILVEALYWSQDDAAMIAESDRLPPGDAEVALFRAIGSLRLGRESSRDLLFDLFLKQRTSSIHTRAYLYLSSDAAGPVRLQGCYVSDSEVHAVVNHWRVWHENQKTYERTMPPWELGLTRREFLSGTDPMLEEAIALVINEQEASASQIQRKLGLGYPRAARIIDLLEELGVIGEQVAGGRSRVVLIEKGKDPYKAIWENRKHDQ